jgi:hypothetical protein
VTGCNDIRCCDRCGRDTTSKAGICLQCLSGRPSFVREKGLSKRRSRNLVGTPKDRQDENKDSADARYHGDNYEG